MDDSGSDTMGPFEGILLKNTQTAAFPYTLTFYKGPCFLEEGAFQKI